MGSNILSGDQLNFTRMGIASVDEVKVALADILRCEIKPEDLHKAINTCSELKSGRHKLRAEQLKICFLSPPAIPDYNKFDVSLLYTLIRNTCPQLKPTQDWGKPPSITDLQIGDDIERLRVFRNEMFAHLDSSNVEDAVFTSQWRNLEQIFQRIQIFVNAKGLSVDYGKKLEKIEKSDFGFEDMEKYRLMLEGMMRLLQEKDANNGLVITIYGNDEILCGERMCFEAVLSPCSSSNNWPITWEKIQGNITEQLDISKQKYRGSSSRCLVISHVLKEDEGEYRAVISRENNGSHIKIPSNSKQLTVMGEIPTVNMPKEVEVPLGSAAVFQPDIQAYPIPESVLWQKSKGTDPESGKFEFIDVTGPKCDGSTLDPTNPKLIINETAFEDSRFYQIVVENKVGKSCCTTFLNVTGSPPNVIMNHDTDFSERSVTLICKVICESSHQLTGVVWTKDNDEIDVTSSKGKYIGGDIKNPSLKITNLDTIDAGIYQCRASNAVGSTQSEPVTLAVPNVKLLMRDKDIENGALKLQAFIKCIPDAFKVEWKVQMTPGDEFRPINLHEGTYKGTTISLPNPFLVVNRYNSKIMETYRIDVTNFLGVNFATNQEAMEENQFTEEKARDCVNDDILTAIFNMKGSSIRFNNLRLDLIREIPDRELNSLKESLKVTAKKLSTENITSMEGFFAFLLEKGIFKERNVIMMQYLMRSIKRPDLELKCLEYAMKDKRVLCYFEETKLPGDGDKHVQLHVVDDIEQFTDMDSLLATVAAIVSCDQSCIKVVGLHPKSSFIITISMKEEFARTLRQKGPHGLTGLLKYNVDWVKVENEIIYIAGGSITDSGEHEMHFQEKEKMESPVKEKERPKENLGGDNVGDKPWGDFSDDVPELKRKHREEQIMTEKEEKIKISRTIKSEPSIVQLGFRKHPLKHTAKQITRGIEAEIKESKKPSGYVVELGDLPSGSTKNVPVPSDYVLPPPKKIRRTGRNGKLQEEKKPSGCIEEFGDLPSGSTKNVPDPIDYVSPPPKKICRKGSDGKLQKKGYRVPMITPGISSGLRRSSSLSRIDTLEKRTPRRESDIVLHSIEYIDCSGICGRSTMHCYPGTIESCNPFSIQSIMEWTKYCSEKLREARSQKCKCFMSLFCVLITIERKGVLANVDVHKLEFIVKHFVDFAIESRNYILLSELVRLHGFQFDFQLDTIFVQTSKMIDTETVDTIVQSAKCIILRKYSSLLQNSVQLTMCYDCGKENRVTIVLSFKGTIETIDLGQERVMGKKLVFYNEAKPSDEASSIFRSFSTSCSRETLPQITAKVARKLFNKHSNLTMISASPYKSVGYSKGKHTLVKQPCVLLLCRHKGYIPHGQEEFPRIIEDFEVDVQEGFCTFGMGGSLEMGGHIRRKGSKSSGSIGGFLYRNGKKALITCAHVVLTVQELANGTINSAYNADEVEAYIRKTRSYQVCGKVVRAQFPNNNTPSECSVDAAIIELDSSFRNSDFRSVAAEQLISAGFDADDPVVFRGTIIPNERKHDISGSVVKFGAKTGFTVGSLFHENMHVRISKGETLKLFDILGHSEIPCEVNVYNQMEIEGLTEQFFEVGDSGSFVFCIQDDTISCIGMAIGLTTRGTCLVTPIENIMKSFGLSVTDTIFLPAEAKLQSKIETHRILDAIAQMQSSLQTDMVRHIEEQRKHLQEIKKDIEKKKTNE